MSEQKPIFLVAMPQLGDPNFKRSVVLMLSHDQEGAVGLVINSAMNMTLGAFAANQKLPCNSEIKSVAVLKGGPVDQQRGWVLHNDETILEKRELAPGLFVSGSNETLIALLEEGQTPIRLVLGYAGWGAGQLEQEMSHGAWLSAPVNVEHVFETDPAEIWKSVLDDLGVNPASLAIGHGVH